MDAVEGWQKGHVSSFADHQDGTVIGHYIANSQRAECFLFEPAHVIKGTQALVTERPADDFFKLVKVLHGQDRLWPAVIEGFTHGVDDLFTSSSPPSAHNLAKLFLVASLYPDLSKKFQDCLQGANRFLAYKTGADSEADLDLLALFHEAARTPDIFLNRNKNLRDVFSWCPPSRPTSPKSHSSNYQIEMAWNQLVADLKSGEKTAPDWVRISLGYEVPRTVEEQALLP